MLELRNLSKTYSSKDGGFVALKNICLQIEKGDIYGVIGLSGAGKSTLVRCINGLERFDAGEILFNGKPVVFDSAYKRKVSMIFQGFNLLQQRTVLKNVELAGEIVKDKNRHEKALRLLEAVGLKDKINSYPSELSGGQCQRVAIARALMTDPEILLCDEATSALDPDTTKSILQLIKKLNEDFGITVVIISHQMSVIEAICTKVAIIDHSEIVENGNIQDIFLSPKTAIAKKLIYSGHVFASNEQKLIKVMFDGQVDLPIITGIVQDCNILISVLYAESKQIGGKTYGQTIFELPYYDEDVEKLKAYLTEKGVKFEEVNANELS